MEEKIEEQERESLAHQEVTEALGPGTLEDDFKVLESGGGTADVEDRLLALKQGMGLIAAPVEEEPRQLESGDDDEAAETASTSSEGGGEGSQASGPVVHEAELIDEFDKLEQKGDS
jgi:hypothetical protein